MQNLLYITGIIPLLMLFGNKPDITLLIYLFFLLVFFFRIRLAKALRFITLPKRVIFLILISISGLLFEILAWTSNFLQQNQNPALLHPQLIPDLLLAIGFYASWAVGWVIATKKFTYSVKEVFILQGIYGIVLEQSGEILISGLTNFPFGIYLWIYVFIVYGSIIGIPFSVLYTSAVKKEKSAGWYKHLFALLIIFAITFLISSSWNHILIPLLPSKKSIVEFPFW